MLISTVNIRNGFLGEIKCIRDSWILCNNFKILPAVDDQHIQIQAPSTLRNDTLG